MASRMYNSNSDYADFYTFSADEWIFKQLMSKFKSLIPNDTRRCMIIGPGPDPHIGLIIDYFDELILVEPNPIFISKWKSLSWWNKSTKLNKKITIIPTVIENLWLFPHKYTSILKFNSMDAIVSTHVAYYFPVEYMDNILSFLISLLKVNTGILTTGVSDDQLDLNVITKEMNPKWLCSQLIEESIRKMKLKYAKLMEYQEIELPDLNTVVAAIKFFVKEGGFNKNWFSNALSTEQEEQLDKLAINFAKTLKKSKQTGCYLLPNHTLHFVIEAKKSMHSYL